MTKRTKLLIVAGARPNFMKVAPLIKAIPAFNQRQPASAPAMEFRLVHTGQHYDPLMSDIFFQELGIPAPDINLGVGSGSHASQTANIMIGFEQACLEQKPDWVIVVGDVNSTVACTLVGAKLGIRVAHVEAGLRSFDRTMPEEINRLATDAIADLLLTPSPDANENLGREGVAPARIKLVGNIMIDSLCANLAMARASRILATLNIRPGEFIYVTLHRPANVDHRESLTAIMAEFNRIGARFPIIFPMHPRTRKMVAEFGLAQTDSTAIRIVEPIGYYDSLCLTENARVVLTDSGGLQVESTYFQTPCLTLRPNTERPVTITVGSNKLTDVRALPADFEMALAGPRRAGRIPELWDGHTATRILDALAGFTPPAA